MRKTEKTTTVQISREHLEKLDKISVILREPKNRIIEEYVDILFAEMARQIRAMSITSMIYREFLYLPKVKMVTFLKGSETDKMFKKQLLKHGIAIMAVDDDKLWTDKKVEKQ